MKGQPEAGPYWSLMFEVSESHLKPVNQKIITLGGAEWPEVLKKTIIGALNTQLISTHCEIVNIYQVRCRHWELLAWYSSICKLVSLYQHLTLVSFLFFSFHFMRNCGMFTA